MIHYPKPLLNLISHLQKLPGVGKKTAERFAFQLLDWKKSDLEAFSLCVSLLKEQVQTCLECSCLMEGVSCNFCHNEKRDPSLLCVIGSARDAYAIENTGNFNGHYHVLGTLLSPLEGKTPDMLCLSQIKNRIKKLQVHEMIIALDSTLEGDATSLFLSEQLHGMNVKISRLALGLPVGSSLDFIDEGTLSQAFSGRKMI